MSNTYQLVVHLAEAPPGRGERVVSRTSGRQILYGFAGLELT